VERANDLAEAKAGTKLGCPGSRQLADRKPADVPSGRGDCLPEVRRQCAGSGLERSLRNLDAAPSESVEPPRILQQRSISAFPDIMENRPPYGFGFRHSAIFARQEPSCILILYDPDPSPILSSGYSTMPSPPACFNRGMMVRTVDSSRIVFTASQSSS